MSRAWERLVAGAPELARVPDLARARRTIEGYGPGDERQARARAFVLDWIDGHPDALWRSCLEGHLTASGLVLDARGERGLLTLHRKLGRWLQLGGHCDGDGNLAGSAMRECVEESGIEGLAIDPRVIDLDCHRIPARPGEPEHWHLDARFLVYAPEGAVERANGESDALRWFSRGELGGVVGDESVERLFGLGMG